MGNITGKDFDYIVGIIAQLRFARDDLKNPVSERFHLLDEAALTEMIDKLSAIVARAMRTKS